MSKLLDRINFRFTGKEFAKPVISGLISQDATVNEINCEVFDRLKEYEFTVCWKAKIKCEESALQVAEETIKRMLAKELYEEMESILLKVKFAILEYDVISAKGYLDTALSIVRR